MVQLPPATAVKSAPAARPPQTLLASASPHLLRPLLKQPLWTDTRCCKRTAEVFRFPPMWSSDPPEPLRPTQTHQDPLDSPEPPDPPRPTRPTRPFTVSRLKLTSLTRVHPSGVRLASRASPPEAGELLTGSRLFSAPHEQLERRRSQPDPHLRLPLLTTSSSVCLVRAEGPFLVLLSAAGGSPENRTCSYMESLKASSRLLPGCFSAVWVNPEAFLADEMDQLLQERRCS